MKTRLLAMILLLSSLFASGAYAHGTSLSYLQLNQIPTSELAQSMALQVSINLRDLYAVTDIDPNADGQITWGELHAAQREIEQYILSSLHIRDAHQQPCALQPQSLLTDTLADGSYAIVSFVLTCNDTAKVEIESQLLFDINPAQRTLVSAAGRDTAVLTQTHNLWQGSFIESSHMESSHTESSQTSSRSAAANPSSLPQLLSSFIDFLLEGIWHIWTGYDHLAFLMLLLLPVVLSPLQHQAATTRKQCARKLLRIITAFTIAHSITLALAALNIITLPTRLTESAIALSIIITGVTTAAFNMQSGSARLSVYMAFGFGLIHGVGFASALSGLNTTGTSKSLALLGFNLGVEIGQLIVVALVMPLLYQLNRWPTTRRPVLQALSLLLSATGVVWLWQRMLS